MASAWWWPGIHSPAPTGDERPVVSVAPGGQPDGRPRGESCLIPSPGLGQIHGPDRWLTRLWQLPTPPQLAALLSAAGEG